MMFRRALRDSLSLFRARSPTRDIGNDLEKTEHVRKTIQQMRVALDLERCGLQKRHNQAQARASILLAAVDAESDGDRLESLLNEMEAAMLYCEGRSRDIRRLMIQFDALYRQAGTITVTGDVPGLGGNLGPAGLVPDGRY